MPDPIFRSDMTVQLVDFMGGDQRVVQAAKVSTQGSDALDADGTAGFINFLMREKHAVPFEHSVFTFLFECPIFVSREIVKHRMSSISEVSGRYKVLDGVFYTPREDRNLVQIGKTGDYTFVPGTYMQYTDVQHAIEKVSTLAHNHYQWLVHSDVAKEVARMVLPVNTYTSMVMTLNARSLMNFLSLRVKDAEGALVPSHAMDEISLLAGQVEMVFAEKMPATYKAFIKHGRVAP